ncbi:MAG: rhodanese-like domain-containing protein [Salinibacter sp.]|uniref:rhodanese-like domain-containing protein n=1 Tax=Salinibacter sp. TaxID=2065818 RepID=UPI0035D4BB43
MRNLFAFLLCLLVVQTGCSQDLTWQAVEHMIAADYPNVPSIPTDSLAERLAEDTRPHPLLLDARSSEEYAVSHLRGARRVAPSAEAYPALDTLASGRPIVVYCSVGYRSAGVAQTLRDQGFTNVANLKGSIFRWANEGRPVYRAGQRVEGVHPYNASWGTLLTDSLHAYQPTPPSQ